METKTLRTWLIVFIIALCGGTALALTDHGEGLIPYSNSETYQEIRDRHEGYILEAAKTHQPKAYLYGLNQVNMYMNDKTGHWYPYKVPKIDWDYRGDNGFGMPFYKALRIWAQKGRYDLNDGMETLHADLSDPDRIVHEEEVYGTDSPDLLRIDGSTNYQPVKVGNRWFYRIGDKYYHTRWVTVVNEAGHRLVTMVSVVDWPTTYLASRGQLPGAVVHQEVKYEIGPANGP